MQKKDNVKIIAGFIVDDYITNENLIKQYSDNIYSFMNLVDSLFIYNTKNQDLTAFLEQLNKLCPVKYAECIGYSEAEVYDLLYSKAIEDNADYAVMMKNGFMYDEDNFGILKKYLIEADTSNLAVLTPMPLYACQTHERKAEDYRLIKGCKLLGALVNIEIYKQTDGIKIEYYQTTFDYEYCLRIRHLGYDVMLSQNTALRNQNYRIISKKFFFITLTTYERSLMDVYYETRNRYFLWQEYKKIDPSYVKLDKRIAAAEKQELFFRDKNYREKFDIMKKAKKDFEENKLGRYEE